MINLPLEYKERMKSLLGDEYPLYENTLEQPPQKAFRINTKKIAVEDFLNCCDLAKEKIPYVENGFYLDSQKIGNHPLHHAGAIYVQEPAAMAPAECAPIEKGWKVLDMCAAPGGKSSQLKAKIGEDGVLVSNEIIPSRCKILTGNMERLGFKNVVTTCMDTEKLATVFPATFDMVMVDAPCSGEGMFRKEEKAVTEWSAENVKMCAARQINILENAAKTLKNGGYIVYATCTFSLEENEMVIDEFLQNHPEFEILPVKNEIINSTRDGIRFDGCKCENINYARRFYPHVSRGEGQFMALLHNKNEGENYDFNTRKNEKIDSCVFDFLDNVLESYDKSQVTMYNGNPIYFTPDFEVKKGVAFSCGVNIGEVRKNYIQPHHQFFMAMGDKFKRKIELPLDSEDLRKYLHGEEINTDCENGWAVVTVCGCTVGGVKVVSGRAKNHYPKGLRSL